MQNNRDKASAKNLADFTITRSESTNLLISILDVDAKDKQTLYALFEQAVKDGNTRAVEEGIKNKGVVVTMAHIQTAQGENLEGTLQVLENAYNKLNPNTPSKTAYTDRRSIQNGLIK